MTLKLDAQKTTQALVAFIKDTLSTAGFARVVLGLSGGIDSALSCYLAARALGPQNVLALRLPYQTSSPQSLAHAQLVINATGAQSKTISITEPVDAILNHLPDATPVRKGNVMARLRMTLLYDQSAAFDGLVLGTSNKTEILLGYSTIHGDAACALNPLGDLYKTQIIQLAESIGVPQAIIAKPPSADLWPGQTDEDDLGFTYEEVDNLLYRLIEESATVEECLAAGFEEEFVNSVIVRVKGYRFKNTLPPVGGAGQQPLATLERIPAFR
ncbi:MAG: NAD(+) synthetase [Anaerolineaceae bacterium 4572_5.1]|nr:MAG: NAD(+) synthetase [Anaerolineaceae bacterium 4572_5.1]RLD04957.1 MAG: NAD(+) synthetase [Chloroflexota bacterium]